MWIFWTLLIGKDRHEVTKDICILHQPFAPMLLLY